MVTDETIYQDGMSNFNCASFNTFSGNSSKFRIKSNEVCHTPPEHLTKRWFTKGMRKFSFQSLNFFKT